MSELLKDVKLLERLAMCNRYESIGYRTFNIGGLLIKNIMEKISYV